MLVVLLHVGMMMVGWATDVHGAGRGGDKGGVFVISCAGERRGVEGGG